MSSIPTIQTGTQHCQAAGALVPIPESANPGLKKIIVPCFVFTVLCIAQSNILHYMLSLLNLGVKTQQYFTSSSDMFLDNKNLA